MENKPEPTKEVEPGVELGELTEREKRLILAIRIRYRYGELKIITRDGEPFRLKIAERFEDLSRDS